MAQQFHALDASPGLADRRTEGVDRAGEKEEDVQYVFCLLLLVHKGRTVLQSSLARAFYHDLPVDVIVTAWVLLQSLG